MVILPLRKVCQYDVRLSVSRSIRRAPRAWTLPVSYPCVCSIYDPGVTSDYRGPNGDTMIIDSTA